MSDKAKRRMNGADAVLARLPRTRTDTELGRGVVA